MPAPKEPDPKALKEPFPVKEAAQQPPKQEAPKKGETPEPVSQDALDKGRVQPNPNTEGMTLEDENKQAEEEKKVQEERKELLKSIVSSPEGFLKREEGNADMVDGLVAEGDAYKTNVQSGPGGTQVEERVFLTEQGYTKIR